MEVRITPSAEIIYQREKPYALDVTRVDVAAPTFHDLRMESAGYEMAKEAGTANGALRFISSQDATGGELAHSAGYVPLSVFESGWSVDTTLGDIGATGGIKQYPVGNIHRVLMMMTGAETEAKPVDVVTERSEQTG